MGYDFRVKDVKPIYHTFVNTRKLKTEERPLKWRRDQGNIPGFGGSCRSKKKGNRHIKFEEQ